MRHIFKISFSVFLFATLALMLIFYLELSKDESYSFEEKVLPPLNLKTFDGTYYSNDQLDSDNYKLINVWATWCVNCKLEHGFLMQKKNEGFQILGLNYKDDINKAIKWLNQFGNPYQINLFDNLGDYGFKLGVSGAPETYLLNKKNLIIQKHIGIMSEEVWKNKFKPLIKND